MMMTSNNKFNKHASKLMNRSLICILTCLLISSCGGGISGTGDGGAIVVDTGMVDAIGNIGVADSTDSVSDSDTTMVDATAPTESDVRVQVPDVSQLIPEALQLLNSQNENVSAAQPLVAQLDALQQQVETVLQTIGASQGTPEENISNEFDTTLRYMLDNTETVIASSSDLSASYLFSTNDERVIYVLQQGESLTIRHLIRNSNSLLQATIISLADGTTIFEADQNQNGTQSYLQILSSASITIAFAQHPTDPAIARQREIIDESGSILTVQNCVAATQNCNLDSSWSSEDSTINSQFSTALTEIENRLASINSPVIALPDDVTEAVLTEPSTEDPTDEQILCGIQRVTDSGVTGSLRAFCLLPQPLGQTSVFSETLASGEIFYQLLE